MKKKLLLIFLCISICAVKAPPDKETIRGYGSAAYLCPDAVAFVNMADGPESISCMALTACTACTACTVELPGYCIKLVANNWIAPLTGAIFNFTMNKESQARGSTHSTI